MKDSYKNYIVDILMAATAIGLVIDGQVSGRNNTLALGMYALYVIGTIFRVHNLKKALYEYIKGVEFGTFDGQRFPVGTRLTSLENGKLVPADPDTPDDEIVAIVKPDK